MKYITAQRAREIASNWHGGQWSALYQFASSGVFQPENLLHYVHECEQSKHPEYHNVRCKEATKTEQKELQSLINYFESYGKASYGLAIDWQPHPQYGALIPWLRSDWWGDTSNVKALSVPI